VVAEERICATIGLTGPEDRNEAGDKVVEFGRLSQSPCQRVGVKLTLFDGLGRELAFETTRKADAVEIVISLAAKPAYAQTLGMLMGQVSVLDSDVGVPDQTLLVAMRVDSPVFHQTYHLTSPPTRFVSTDADGAFRAVLPPGEYFIGKAIPPSKLANEHETILAVRTSRRESLDVVRARIGAGNSTVTNLVLVPSAADELAPAPRPAEPGQVPDTGLRPPAVGDAGLRRR
jgi:hypothetical protein